MKEMPQPEVMDIEQYSEELEKIVIECLALDAYKDSTNLRYSFVMEVLKALNEKIGRQAFFDKDPAVLKLIYEALLKNHRQLDKTVFTGLLTRHESDEILQTKKINDFKNIGRGLNSNDK